jgi:hypothetical protein
MSNIKSQPENGKCFPPPHNKANNAAAILPILSGKVFNHFICASDFHPYSSGGQLDRSNRAE